MPAERSTASSIEIPPAAGVFTEPWSVQKVWALLRCFGPAAILASMSIGAGETIIVVIVGAWAKYDLLWVILLSCLVKGVFVTYMLGRYTVISGEHVGHGLLHLPGPRGWFLLAIVTVEMVFAPLGWVAMAKPCGNLLHFLIGQNFFDEAICLNLYSTLFVTAALVVSLTLTYERLEKEQLIICGVLVSGTMIGTLMIWPDLWAALKGTFLNVGRLPDSVPEWAPDDAKDFAWLNLATVFAYVGGSVMGYIAYANWVSLRGWGLTGHPQIEQIRQRAANNPRIDYLPDDPEQCRRLRRLAAPLRWDVSLGAAVLFIVTAAFMIAGAAALYDKQTRFEGWDLLTHQAYVWEAIHPWLKWVYYVTVLAAIWGTLTALPEVYSRVIHEFFSAIWPQRNWNYLVIRRVIVCAIFVEVNVVIWANLKFEILTQIAGFFLVNLPVAGAGAAALYLNHKLPPAYRTHCAVFLCTLVSTVILIVATTISAFGLMKKLTG